MGPWRTRHTGKAKETWATLARALIKNLLDRGDKNLKINQYMKSREVWSLQTPRWVS
ncbi:hypothetical protein DsansV1_C05g0053581 [Dioscorea sansibarensis]